VSCTSAAACTAVGYTYNGSVSRTLIESWDGTSWTVVPSPNPVLNDSLAGVSCVSAAACIAVGTQASSTSLGADRILIESWDGTSWTVVPSPKPYNSYLYGVSCVSAAACIAVGNLDFPHMMLSWDGTSWSLVTNPERGDYPNVLDSISCVSASVCTAAGWSAPNPSAPSQTLIESGTASS
jgi:hypothetical protein